MAPLRMARPTKREGSSSLIFRLRIPADVLRLAKDASVTLELPGQSPDDAPIIVHARLGAEAIKFSLQTTDPALAKARTAAATEQLYKRYQALREGPKPLTHKQRVALAGFIYRAFIEAQEDDPIPGNFWREWGTTASAALKGETRHAFMIGTAEENSVRSLEHYFGVPTDAALQRHGVITDAASRVALLKEVGKAVSEVAGRLQRNANGDYSADTNADRFPAWQPTTTPPQRPAGGITLDDLLSRWIAERKPAASTAGTYAGHVKRLKNHLGHDDAGAITQADIIGWKDAMVSEQLQSVRTGPLATVHNLFKFGVENNLISSNPAVGVKVREAKRTGRTQQPYSSAEVARLLSLAASEKSAIIKWIPLLLALTGARVGEIAQLWGARVVKTDGHWSIKIAPAEDGGSLKNEGSERVVPLHPMLVERGFLDFVKSRGDGPLFYGSAGARRSKATSPTRKHASKGVANRLASWIRSKGFDNPRKAPNHALRHWFKTECQRMGVSDSVADAIQGHVGDRGEAERYRHTGIALMAEAICRVRLPTIEGTKNDR